MLAWRVGIDRNIDSHSKCSGREWYSQNISNIISNLENYVLLLHRL